MSTPIAGGTGDHARVYLCFPPLHQLSSKATSSFYDSTMASQASGSGFARRQASGNGSASSSSGSPILEKKRPSYNTDMRSTSSSSNKGAGGPPRRPSSSTRRRSSLKAVREDLDGPGDDYEEEAPDSDETQYDDKDALYEQDKVASEESFGGLHYVSRALA